MLVSEAVTMPSLMMITSMVSEESLARDTLTYRLYKILKAACDFENRKELKLIYGTTLMKDHVLFF